MPRTLIILLIFVITFSSSCKKSKKAKNTIATKYHNSCIIKQVNILLKQHQNLEIRAKSFHLLQGLFKCKDIPKPIRLILHALIPSSRQAKAILFIRSSFLLNHPNNWKRICPEINPKDLQEQVRTPVAKGVPILYSQCDGKIRNILSKEEMQNILSINFISLAILYRWLLDTGSSPQQSRLFLRQALLSHSRFEGIELLASQSRLRYKNTTTVILAPNAVSVNGRKICGIANNQIPHRFKSLDKKEQTIISPLREAFGMALKAKKKLESYKNIEIKASAFSLVIHPSISYDLLYKVIYTAKTMGYTKTNFIVGKKKIPFLGIPSITPISLKNSMLSKKREKKLQHLPEKQIDIFINGRSILRDCNLFSEARMKAKGRLSSRKERAIKSNYQAISHCLEQIKIRQNQAIGIQAHSTLSYRELHHYIETIRYGKNGTIRFPIISLYPPRK